MTEGSTLVTVLKIAFTKPHWKTGNKDCPELTNETMNYSYSLSDDDVSYIDTKMLENGPFVGLGQVELNYLYC